MHCLFKLKQNGWCNAISKLCTGQVTKNESVDHSAEPLRAHWDEEIANKWNIEMKHVWTYSNSKIKNELAKIQCLFKPEQIVGHEAGNAP